jgi:ferredoxin
MKIEVDREKCIGSGQCVLSAENVFDQDELGLVVVTDHSPSEKDQEYAREAARFCPVAAITISEDGADS